jgi:glycosyltransferase involved in cell wall biosynthesis
VSRVGRVTDILSTIWRERRNYACAVVDVYSGMAFTWAESACWLLRKLGKPYILVLHGGSLPAFARHSNRRVHRLLRSAAKVVTPSRYLQEEMRPYRHGLMLLPNPLNVQAYPFQPRGTVRPRLVWLRAFHELYNPGLALQVTAKLTRSFPGVELIMIGPDKGDGSYARTLQSVEAMQLTNRVRLVTGIPKECVPSALQEGDIFLNTTRADNTPVSVMEAMASGLCVVSTNVGGIPYLLEADRDAVLVPSDDAAAMTAGVERILRNPVFAASLSTNARRKVEAFDWAHVLPEWDSLLTSLVGLR